MARRWILLLHKNPGTLTELEDKLAGMGFHFTTANSAAEAAVQARDLKPALVIADVDFAPDVPFLLVGEKINYERLKSQVVLLTTPSAPKPVEPEAASERPKVEVSFAAPVGPAPPRTGKAWVLLVDDDPMILDIVETALSHPSLRITTAPDPLQAFMAARDVPPFLIISDIQMPGLDDGIQMLKQLRSDSRRSTVPVIFMTAMDATKARKLLPPGDDNIWLIPKPIDLDRLRDYVWGKAGIPLEPKT